MPEGAAVRIRIAAVALTLAFEVCLSRHRPPSGARVFRECHILQLPPLASDTLGSGCLLDEALGEQGG